MIACQPAARQKLLALRRQSCDGEWSENRVPVDLDIPNAACGSCGAEARRIEKPWRRGDALGDTGIRNTFYRETKHPDTGI